MGDVIRRGTRDKPRFYIRYLDLDGGRNAFVPREQIGETGAVDPKNFTGTTRQTFERLLRTALNSFLMSEVPEIAHAQYRFIASVGDLRTGAPRRALQPRRLLRSRGRRRWNAETAAEDHGDRAAACAPRVRSGSPRHTRLPKYDVRVTARLRDAETDGREPSRQAF